MTLNTLLVVIAGLAAGLAAVTAASYGLQRAFRYSLGTSTLRISFLGLRCRAIRFSDIEEVEVTPFSALIPLSRSFRSSFLLSEKWNGYKGEVVAIKKRTGWLKGIIISPDDAQEFARSLREAVVAARSIRSGSTSP